MSTLYKSNKGKYVYVKSHDLYSWVNLYQDPECNHLFKTIYGSKFYDEYAHNPPQVIHREQAVNKIIKASLTNELRYILFEIEAHLDKGEIVFEIELENSVSEKTYEILKLLNYSAIYINDKNIKIRI